MYIAEIKLKNNLSISMEPGSVLVLVGPNNSGKSFFLNSIRAQVYGRRVSNAVPNGGLITEIEFEFDGGIEPDEAYVADFFTHRFDTNSHKLLMLPNAQIEDFESYPTLAIASIGGAIREFGAKALLAPFIMQFDEPLGRIHETDLKNYTYDLLHGEDSLVVKLLEPTSNKIETADKSVFSFFQEVFAEPLSFYERHGQVGLIISSVFEKASRAGEARSSETTTHMEKAPKLWEQGLGMRSVGGLLLRVFADDKPILLIDEPEAFLHPPQATALGGILARLAKESRKQVIVATHDRNVLSGISREIGDSVQILRLNREPTGDYSATVVDKDALSTVRKESLIRYTPIFDSLFSQVTVLVENELDAFFYSEALSHWLGENLNEGLNIKLEEVLFISTSGKGALAKTAQIINGLNSNVLIAADLDNLAEPTAFCRLVRSVGRRDVDEALKRYENLHAELLTLVSESVSDSDSQGSLFSCALGCGKPARMTDSRLKKIFKQRNVSHSIPDHLNEKIDQLLEELDRVGICLLSVGELEDFDRTLGRKDVWMENARNAQLHKDPLVQAYISRLVGAMQVISTNN